MSTAVLGLSDFTPSYVRELNKSLTKATKKAKFGEKEYSPDEINRITTVVMALTSLVKSDWAEFPEELKEILKTFACVMVKQAARSGFLGVLDDIQLALGLLNAYRQGVLKEINTLLVEVDSLVDEVLSAIEDEGIAEAFADFDDLEVDDTDFTLTPFVDESSAHG